MGRIFCLDCLKLKTTDAADRGGRFLFLSFWYSHQISHADKNIAHLRHVGEDNLVEH